MERLDCIALRTVRFNDSRDLLTVWTAQHGRLCFSVASGRSREAARRRALTPPLAMFECVADIRPGREFYTIRDIRALPLSAALSDSPIKMMSAQFIAEALDACLRHASADSALSDYLFSSISLFGMLGSADAVNFHLLFLYRLTHFAGIEPDYGSYARGRWFDMRDGVFRAAMPLHSDVLTPEQSRILALIEQTPLRRGGRLPLTRAGRNAALDFLLRYFSIHLSTPATMRSLDILRQLV